ncbi:uncharacterized protein [Fopius arisanus]|uniref:G-protein coupled receptors family 2 profile 2 domain-containing protein n=2 Tax=Fopius arisanus TaxID=64838 RepID=A0A9R1U548_9HYME|nr:PREDICTED: uncharacterized protein LOC105269114 [Fopius arisanus]
MKKTLKNPIFKILIFLLTVKNSHQNTPCDPSQALPLPPEESIHFENGSVFHRGQLYPPELHWKDGNVTFGCFCQINEENPCLVKCCGINQVLSDSDVSNCVSTPGGPIGLQLRPQHLHEDVRHLENAEEHFRVFTREICPGVRSRLQPEMFPEDNFTLYGNGSLYAMDRLMAVGEFCFDLDEEKVLRALVCITADTEAVTVEESVYRLGFVVSIPFLVATFIVYAIIPELRSLYGMTLMCYVGCLIAAYVFLMITQTFVYHGQASCTVIVWDFPVDVLDNYEMFFHQRSEDIAKSIAPPFNSSGQFFPYCYQVEIGKIRQLSADCRRKRDMGTRRIIVVIVLWFCANVQCAGTSMISRRDSSHGNISRPKRSLPDSKKPKLSICCPPDAFMLTAKVMKCFTNSSKPINDPEVPQIYREDLQPSSKDQTSFEMIHRIPCKHGIYEMTREPPTFDVFYLLETGQIFLNSSTNQVAHTYMSIDDYCLSSWMGPNGTFTRIIACYPPLKREIPLPYTISLVLSMPFLAATFLIYASLPELRNIHGMTLMPYVASLFWGYVGLAVVQFGAASPWHHKGFCIFAAMTATLFWPFAIILVLPHLSLNALLPGEENCPAAALIYPEYGVNLTEIISLEGSKRIQYFAPENSTHDGTHDWEIDTESILESPRVNGSCPCLSRSCIAMCCPQGYSLRKNNCVKSGVEEVKFPRIFDSSTLEPSVLDLNEAEGLNGSFHVFEWDPCHGGLKWRLDPKVKADAFKLLDNGSVYTVHNQGIVRFEDYCLGHVDGDVFSVVQCFDMDYEAPPDDTSSGLKMANFMPIGLILSVPCLIATFVVYSILPELDNMHGMILRAYVGQLGLAYTPLTLLKVVPAVSHNEGTCIAFAFIIHFSFLSSFFWLNVMCFDIWWTFGRKAGQVVEQNGGFRALQGSVKQRERKKFIIYSIYAWGCASIITGVCLIMDFVPGIPDSYIKPRFGEKRCWFPDEISKAVYFYGPMGVTVVCNIILFISTAMKILQHKRDTATQLKGIDSRRHDDNKQWFNLYLKLFIVMGINWSMEIISWLLNKDTPQYVWYFTDLANTLQGVIIFIIFVWKDKIRRLLVKRFGCQKGKFQSGNSTRSGYHSSASNRTCTSIALHDKVPVERNRVNTTTDESDCV